MVREYGHSNSYKNLIPDIKSILISCTYIYRVFSAHYYHNAMVCTITFKCDSNPTLYKYAKRLCNKTNVFLIFTTTISGYFFKK